MAMCMVIMSMIESLKPQAPKPRNPETLNYVVHDDDDDDDDDDDGYVHGNHEHD